MAGHTAGAGHRGGPRQAIDWQSPTVRAAGVVAPAGAFLRLVPWWLADLARLQYTAATCGSYATALGLFVAWCHEREVTQAAQVTRAVLEAYQRYLFALRTGRGRGTRAAAVLARAATGGGLPLSAQSQRGRVRPIMRF